LQTWMERLCKYGISHGLSLDIIFNQNNVSFLSRAWRGDELNKNHNLATDHLWFSFIPYISTHTCCLFTSFCGLYSRLSLLPKTL
jgi:hypothetical protein